MNQDDSQDQQDQQDQQDSQDQSMPDVRRQHVLYKKVKLEASNICRQAIDKTNLFHKHFPNRDSLLANVYNNGVLWGNKADLIKIFAHYFIFRVFNNVKDIKRIDLPTENGNFVL
jgi:hypothetical protein